MLITDRPSTYIALLLASAFGLLLAAPLFPSGPALAEAPVSQTGSAWRHLDNDDGIEIWTQEVPGRLLPGFRGQIVIEAGMQHILDEMMDSKHHTDWMYRMKESVVLKELSANDAIVYTRTSAPWPVWDRDVILKVGYTYRADRSHLILRFNSIDSDLRMRPDSVVRMPHLAGFYKMWKVDENITKVLYEVEADIGGSIPKWLAKKASKDLPYITLSALRKRVMARAKR